MLEVLFWIGSIFWALSIIITLYLCYVGWYRMKNNEPDNLEEWYKEEFKE